MSDTASLASTRGKTPLPEVADPDRLEARRKALLAASGIPRSFVRGRRVLQIGGAAESALQWASWGGEVTLLEGVPDAAERAERLFLRHRHPLRIESGQGVLDDPAAMSRFDFVTCEDPLAAGADPLADLERVLAHLARDAAVFVALPETRGWKRRLAMRRIVAQISGAADARAQFARASFPGHLAATARRRGATEAEVLHELFVAARTRPCDLADICRTFAAAGMTHLGSAPSLRAFSFGFDADPFAVSTNARHPRRLEDAWEAFGDELPAVGAEGLARWEAAIGRELEALREIERRVERRDVDDALLRALDSGGFVDRLHVFAAKQ